MSENEEMILDTDDRAARLMTITGWVSRHGRFYGDDERIARYAGCTHRACEDCGKPTPKHWLVCTECGHKRAVARYATYPRKPWNGEGMVYSEAQDRYFAAIEDVLEACEDEGTTPEDLLLVHCTPNYPRPLEASYFEDALPEDSGYDLPQQLAAAIEDFNAAIKDHPPLSWSPTRTAATVEMSE